VDGRYHLAISNACYRLGISQDFVLWSVRAGGHPDLEDLRKTSMYHDLAKILFIDRKELSLIFSKINKSKENENENEDKNINIVVALREIIQDEIDTWFVCVMPDNFQT
jgi:hypothetical protein